MSEIDLIRKYLARAGARVSDVNYYDQTFNFIAAGVMAIGLNDGYIDEHQFFFGNISINDVLGGAVVLTNQNLHTFFFNTLLYGSIDREAARVSMGVGYGMGLLGSGVYQGYKRIYGVGCNRVTAGQFGCGASTITASINLNGYMFTVI
jgi:hypothetical protein